jgi:phenylacetate-CoA ligase
MDSPAERLRCQSLPRKDLERLQLEKLNRLLAIAARDNPLYREKLHKKFCGATLPLASLDGLRDLPFTTKDELLPAESDPDSAARNRTWPAERYVRFHQTSGTRGRPLTVMDTADDWRRWIDTWQFVLDAAEIGPADRAFFAFSFGPFIGFWSAFEAVLARGCLAIPGGGMSTQARLDLIQASQATALFCTPSYALHLAETALAADKNPGEGSVRVIVVAGEPGGSISAVRGRIEAAWNAKVIDHAGATEVGPWGCGDASGRGLHVVEAEFLAEFVSVARGQPAREGELAELVLTTLGREGCPVIRYRTGDLVRPVWDHGLACGFVLLEGGVLGRVDDMLIIRGVNVYPSAVEQVVREFPEIGEFRLTALREGELDQLQLEIEDPRNDAARVAAAFQTRLGLRLRVEIVPPGSLPRFELKARRFVDRRHAS